MAQDIRKLFKNEDKLTNEKMPQGHEARFLNKLDEALPETKHEGFRFNLMKIAASVVILFGLGYGAFKFMRHPIENTDQPQDIVQLKTLGDISPDLKKVEDYYLANINLELSKIKLTPANKELFDSYVNRLQELNAEYKVLSKELTEDGPNERTVDALINNLKFRLDLLYRLKEQLKDISNAGISETSA
ncbi:hypothetical protein RM697_00705 [Ichthyenterobacterium sp. W332]|uniref:Uncharacterized protein n=1 Tax=Microcosmobacter mediterraneus TaxID=3075607 RepID=A0ABU2YHG8_9FLAO|nr:hypothetical protein [Ichthyenterobacterium sp. W332]MDT0557144.1 hypothetical protein [Ichthyenterobacterium sp. W332]